MMMVRVESANCWIQGLVGLIWVGELGSWRGWAHEALGAEVRFSSYPLLALPRLQKHNLAFSTELASILTSKITLAVILRKVEFGEKFNCVTSLALPLKDAAWWKFSYFVFCALMVLYFEFCIMHLKFYILNFVFCSCLFWILYYAFEFCIMSWTFAVSLALITWGECMRDVHKRWLNESWVSDNHSYQFCKQRMMMALWWRYRWWRWFL